MFFSLWGHLDFFPKIQVLDLELKKKLNFVTSLSPSLFTIASLRIMFMITTFWHIAISSIHPLHQMWNLRFHSFFFLNIILGYGNFIVKNVYFQDRLRKKTHIYRKHIYIHTESTDISIATLVGFIFNLAANIHPLQASQTWTHKYTHTHTLAINKLIN